MASNFLSLLGLGPMPLGGMRGATPPFMPNAPVPLPQTPNTTAPQLPPANIPPWLQKFQGISNRVLGASPEARQASIASLLQSAAPRPKGTGSPIADIGSAMMAGQQAQFAADERDLNKLYRQAQMQYMTAQQQQAAAELAAKLAAARRQAEQDQRAANKDVNEQVNVIADDNFTQSRDFIVQRDSLGRIRASADEPSAAGDLALIFNYMKMLDPGSTVREGEFANAQNAGGVGDRIVATYNSILRGERLSEEQRKDFVGRAERMFGEARGTQEERNKRFGKRATQSGVPEDRLESIFIPLDPTVGIPTMDEEQPLPKPVPRPTQAPSRHID